MERYLYSFVLLGKHSWKEGSGRKAGELGSTVCEICLLLSFIFDVVESSSSSMEEVVKVALGPEFLKVGKRSNPGKKDPR